ncbi:MAG: AAC(3) family N-acetyltransferase [bacterium]|nr:AAC(3) family N-acetyltransferase [bacterium]
MVTKHGIIQGLQELGLTKGGIALVHSSLSSFGDVDGGVETVIDALLETVGEEGTIIVPTLTGTAEHNADNPPVFDPINSSCWTGKIPETFRHRVNAVRSLHPTHSVAAIGNLAEYIIANHEQSETPCALDSPYGKLFKLGGSILLLGVMHSSSTLLHLVEEIAQSPYHMQPEWVDAQLITPDGTTTTVRCQIHLWGWDRDFNKIDTLLSDAGIQRIGKIGKSMVRLIAARPTVELVLRKLESDPLYLLIPEAKKAFLAKTAKIKVR